jgi:CBS domain-containing protein
LKVDEIMSSPIVAVKPIDTVGHAKNLMLRYKMKHLVVVDRGKPVGILSMSDIAEYLGKGSAAWRRRPVDNVLVARLMRKGVLVVSVGTDLKKAAALMLKRNMGSLVVQDGENIAGIVTKTDLTRSFAESLGGRVKVRDLMSHELVTVGHTRSLTHIVELMKKRGVDRVIVVEGKRPVGMITEGDIAFAQLEQPGEGIKEREVKYTRKLEQADRPRARYFKRMASVTAEDVMRPRLLTIGADEDAARASVQMIKQGISGLPVIEGEKLVGIITKTDLVKGMASLGV